MRWIYAGGASLKGSSHRQNDDAIYHSDNGPIGPNGSLAIICDGVSSVPDGGWAAETVKDSFKKFFARTADIKHKQLINHITSVNQSVRSAPKKKGACTMVLLWIQDDTGHLISVGDSQVALLRKKELIVYTHERETGGRLSQFIGMKGDIKGSLSQQHFQLQDGDLILLMSDGVAEIVGSTDVFHMWKHCYEDPQLCAERLVQLAQYSGSTDDNSAVVLQYRSEDS